MSRAINCQLPRQHCPSLASKDRQLPKQDLRTSIQTPTRRTRSRAGLTLIEIMIALTMTLIVLGAMAQAFKFASAEIANGRAVLEMSNRLRNAQQLLRTDLAGLTVDVRPHTETAPNGYFEYVDGVNIDSTLVNTDNGYLGDWDDILAFTTRNLDGSFRGRFDNQPIQSAFAEVVWFTQVLDVNSDGNVVDAGTGTPLYEDSVALYRRVLLVRPDLNEALTNATGTAELDANGNQLHGIQLVDTLEEARLALVNNDISMRLIDVGSRFLLAANSLTDLARRENRFGRSPVIPYPHEIGRSELAATQTNTGDDILLTDLAAFDVQLYSPDAPVDLVDIDSDSVFETALDLADTGFNLAATNSSNGSFVDLAVTNNNFSSTEPRFTTNPFERRPGTPVWGFPTYCTWSPHYESDGIDQDGVLGADSGINGIDDDDANGVDDDDELDTAPPYPFPVRGMKVTFRIIEKNSKQVRQTSVIQNFLPQ